MSLLNAVLYFLSIDNVAVTVLGYAMSYVELLGTVLYLWSVWLIAQRRMLTWPVGIVSVLLYMALFYQIRLYSDTLEQVYYLGASVYGWWHWKRSQAGAERQAAVAFSRRRGLVAWAAFTAAAGFATGLVMSRLHLWWPAAFPEPASFPYIDALTTLMSFTAMWLMARKKIESWVYWILVDILGIWLYFVKDVKLLSALYAVLLVMAIGGLFAWLRSRRTGGAGEDSAAAEA